MKKVGSIVLVISIMLGMFGVTVQASPDTSEKMNSEKFWEETRTLIDLSVLCGVDLEAVKPFSNVKKYQVVNYIYSMFFDNEFGDEYNADAAMFAQGIGSLSDAASLKPTDELTVNEAAKMFVEALGYGDLARYNGGWPSGYILYANRLKLLDGVTVAGEDKLKFYDLVMLLYNTAICDLPVPTRIGNGIEYEIYEGGTILSNYRNIYYGTGVVTENYHTSLWGEGSINENSVSIDTDTYLKGNTNADDLIGYPVDFYYKKIDSSTFELLHIEKNKNIKELKIDVSDIVDINDEITEITYFKDNKQRNIRFENAKIIYNGQLYDECSAEELMAEKGTLTVIDSDGTGGYDVICADIAATVLVDGVNKNDKTLRNKLDYTGGVSMVDLNTEGNYGVLKITKAGKEIKFNDINEWDVLEIRKSKSKVRPVIKVEVCSEPMTCKADSVSDESITVGEEEYHFSVAFKNARKGKSGYTEINAGEQYVFYLNSDLEIVAAKISKGADMNIGYALKMYCVKSLDSKVGIRIFTDKKEWLTYELADKVWHNGVRREADKVYEEEILKGNGVFAPGLVKYRLNADDKISELETPVNDDGNIESRRLRFRPIYGQYRHNDNSINSKYYLGVDGKTNYWIIPSEENRYDESLYNLTTDRFYLEKDYDYDFVVYNLDEYNFSTNVTVVYDVTADSPSGNFFVVSEVITRLNKDKDPEQCIVGSYKDYDKMILIAENEGMFDAVEPGYILTVNPNQNAVISETNGFAVQYKSSDGIVYYNTGNLYSKFARMSGIVEKADLKLQRMAINNGNETIFRRCFDSPYVVIYHKGSRSIERGNIGSLSAGDFVVYREFWGTLSDIVVIRD